ncbi:MAG: membrane protein insertase YidC, partial [Leadbetterella sp.]
MERLDKNTIIGFLLMIGMYGAWLYYYNSTNPQKQEIPQTQKVSPEKKNIPTTKSEIKPQDTTQTAQVVDIYVENDKFKAVFSSLGAQLKSLELKDYKSYDDFKLDAKKPLLLYGNNTSQQKLLAQLGAKNIQIESLGFTSSSTNIKLQGGQKAELVFSTNTAFGIIQKKISFSGDSYQWDENINLAGLNPQPTVLKYEWTNELHKLENDIVENRKASQINYFDKDEEFTDVGLSSTTTSDDDTDSPVK